MKRVVLLAVMFLTAVLFGGLRAMAGEAPATGETWKAEWRNRFTETKGEWVFVWTERAGELNGTVTVDGVSHTLAGKRDGSWWELNWKDAEGRMTQVRGAGGSGEWRGVVLSGGGGRLVEYGRVRVWRSR